MSVEIENIGPKLEPAAIDELEIAIGAKFPEKYRSFLLEKNGGQPWPDIVDVAGLSDSPADVSVILGIGREVESSNLTWAMGVYSHFASDGLMPIALDSGGNLYALSLRKEDYGSVLYIDLLDDDENSYNVAESFDAFLDKFREL